MLGCPQAFRVWYPIKTFALQEIKEQGDLLSTSHRLASHSKIYHEDDSRALKVSSQNWDKSPCQNSTTSGTIRKPPQKGGTGISSTPSNCSLISFTLLSNSSLPLITELCGDAQAPICELRGLVLAYCWDSSGVSRSVVPSIRTCRSKCSHQKFNAARGFVAKSLDFFDVWKLE